MERLATVTAPVRQTPTPTGTPCPERWSQSIGNQQTRPYELSHVYGKARAFVSAHIRIHGADPLPCRVLLAPI